MNEAEGSKNSLQHRIKKEKNLTDGYNWDGKTPCEEAEKNKRTEKWNRQQMKDLSA